MPESRKKTLPEKFLKTGYPSCELILFFAVLLFFVFAFSGIPWTIDILHFWQLHLDRFPISPLIPSITETEDCLEISEPCI